MQASGEHRRWLAAETDRLLAFGRASADPSGGFGWLRSDGTPDPGRPKQLWITCRMTHVYALGHLLGRPGCAELVDHGLDALTGLMRDAEHGGWFSQVGDDGPVAAAKSAYDHAFVVLAGASATEAGRPGGKRLLADALDVLLGRFWDEDAGMLADACAPDWSSTDPYRGMNANMHGVEALVAAADARDDDGLRAKALRVVERAVHTQAPAHGWLLPEHYDERWTPQLGYNRDLPDDQFRPYGATIGHSLEWSRLAVQLGAALGDRAPQWLVPDAQALFATAVERGWDADGAPGFVYTVDWDGTPVNRHRMHWVAAEAIGAAAVLHAVTGEASYAHWYGTWWDYAAACLLDHEQGSWQHELDADNTPSSGTWDGKPDVYHALQATLFPRLPAAPTIAAALRQARLDTQAPPPS